MVSQLVGFAKLPLDSWTINRVQTIIKATKEDDIIEMLIIPQIIIIHSEY